MRDVFETLERLGIGYFLTGSEALGRYGQPRQTMDIDIVLDLTPRGFPPVAREFEKDYVVADPIDFSGHWMASIIAISGLGKVDLILRRRDPWGRASMERRERWEHPTYGPLWISSLEDLLLAKLEWSDGRSELQLRDCRNLIVGNRESLDWDYLERWATSLRIAPLLEEMRHAS